MTVANHLTTNLLSPKGERFDKKNKFSILVFEFPEGG